MSFSNQIIGPDGLPSYSAFVEAMERLNALANISAGTFSPLSITWSGTGFVIQDNRLQGRWIKITSGTNPYAWTGNVDDGAGSLATDDDTGASGTTTIIPAYEVHGKADVAANTTVWAWPALDGLSMLFDISSFASSPVTLTNNFTVTDNSNTVTINAPITITKPTTYQIQTVTPSNPSTGYVKLYVKDNELMILYPDGTSCCHPCATTSGLLNPSLTSLYLPFDDDTPDDQSGNNHDNQTAAITGDATAVYETSFLGSGKMLTLTKNSGTAALSSDNADGEWDNGGVGSDWAFTGWYKFSSAHVASSSTVMDLGLSPSLLIQFDGSGHLTFSYGSGTSVTSSNTVTAGVKTFVSARFVNADSKIYIRVNDTDSEAAASLYSYSSPSAPLIANCIDEISVDQVILNIGVGAAPTTAQLDALYNSGYGTTNPDCGTIPQSYIPKDVQAAQISSPGGAEMVIFDHDPSAVNQLTISNAPTGSGPTLAATGDDTDIDVNITPKGTGGLKVAGDIWIQNSGLYVQEEASAGSDTAGYGQLWIKTATPNMPMFTDDSGADARLFRELKGADVASADPLVLGTDGNYFDVTGTTGFASISTLGAGNARVLLQFDGILTITHHATNLVLPTGANITTAAGDHAEFVEYGSGTWRCTSYTRADGTALAGSSSGSGGPFATPTLTQQTVLTNTTPVDIVDAPASGTLRVVPFCKVVNRDTVTHELTLRLHIGGSDFDLVVTDQQAKQWFETSWLAFDGTNSDKLQALTDAAATTTEPFATCTYVDDTDGSLTGITGVNAASFSGTATGSSTTVVGSPAASTLRTIRRLLIYNADSVYHTFSIEHNIDGVTSVQQIADVGPGEWEEWPYEDLVTLTSSDTVKIWVDATPTTTNPWVYAAYGDAAA